MTLVVKRFVDDSLFSVVEARNFAVNPIILQLKDQIERKFGDSVELFANLFKSIALRERLNEQLIYPYYKWVVIRYVKESDSEFPIEKLDEVLVALQTYHNLKRTGLVPKDINQISSIEDLLKLVATYSDVSARELYLIGTGDLEVLYNSMIVKVSKLNSTKATSFYKLITFNDSTTFNREIKRGSIYLIGDKLRPKEKFIYQPATEKMYSDNDTSFKLNKIKPLLILIRYRIPLYIKFE